MDTSSAKQDEVDIGRDGADAVGGTEPRPRGFPTRTEAARQPDAMAAGRRWRESANEMMKVDGLEKKGSEQLAATGPPGEGGGGG